MSLNLSYEQIAAELDLSANEVQAMTRQLREGIVLKKSPLPYFQQVTIQSLITQTVAVGSLIYTDGTTSTLPYRIGAISINQSITLPGSMPGMKLLETGKEPKN